MNLKIVDVCEVCINDLINARGYPPSTDKICLLNVCVVVYNGNG